jgi:NTE family protein
MLMEKTSPTVTANPAYAIFEGGGAKGITHIGAVKALENARFEVVGASGSSAGAIIAALVAAGYRADEIYDAVSGTHLLGDRTPIDLLGRAGWRRLTLLRKIAKPVGALLCALLIVDLLLLGFGPLGVEIPAAAATAALAALVAYMAWPIVIKRGLFDSATIRHILDDLLRDKVNEQRRKAGRQELADGERVRFEHLAITGCVPLKVIVSDARSGKLVVFDRTTPNVVIADAVAASAAIPFVIRSPEIAGDGRDGHPIFVDGGLISNLPAWAFRNEKRALERELAIDAIPIFAFTLDPMESTKPRKRSSNVKKPGFVGFLSSVIKTGIFGSQEVVQEFVPDLVVIPLPSPLDTLSFDCSGERATAAFNSGFFAADAALTQRRRIRQLTDLSLTAIRSEMDQIVRRRRGAIGRPAPRLRLTLVDPVDARRTAFHVFAGAEMGSDADDRLELDSRNMLAPEAFRKNSPVFDYIGKRPARELMMTKYERALVCPEVASVICVPILPVVNGAFGTEPERVLCLDSSDSLQDEFNDKDFIATFVNKGVVMAHRLIEQQFKENRNG